MNNETKITEKKYERQSGAALVTVLMISVLLGIACVAMLSAVGANSRNSTDVLSETKAYYAAESGLQATINVLRGNTDTTPLTKADDIDYTKASTPSTSNYSTDPSTAARLSAWITYNYPTTGTPNRIVVGEAANAYNPNSGTAYSVVVSDPDNTTTSLTFNTLGAFLSYNGATAATFSADAKTIYIPNETASPRTRITFADAASTTHTFTSNPILGSFTIEHVGGGVNLGETKFQVDYRLTAPRAATISMIGYIKPVSASDPKNGTVTFASQEYKLLGSKMELCSTATSPMTGENRCPTVTFTLNTATPSATLRADITPLLPYRLLVKSTGYGPNGAKKELEGIVQKDFFNGLGSGAATTMLGRSRTAPVPSGQLPFLFSPGTSSGVAYCGGVMVGNTCTCPETMACVPSFGLTNTDNLNFVTSNPPSGNPAQMQPPPALLNNNIPDWQQTPEALDLLVDQLRDTAKRSGRHFVNPTGDNANFTVGSNQNPPGVFDDGTGAGRGITFCEGSCKMGASGGGILVVTGKLTNVGNFSFRGMIIVTGEEGWDRNGGGNGQVIGNVIIAPYNKRTYIPENLTSTFMAPRYEISGGGGSDVIYDDISATLDGTGAITDFMLGIAEK